MATSGLFLLARGLSMQRALSRAFAEREVDKRYEAVVDGTLGPPGAEGGRDHRGGAQPADAAVEAQARHDVLRARRGPCRRASSTHLTVKLEVFT